MLLLQNALGEAASQLTVVATKALPWACRKEGPATVNIRGIKDRVFIVVLPDGPMNTYLATQLVSGRFCGMRVFISAGRNALGYIVNCTYYMTMAMLWHRHAL
jgi:hypothetical protein